jgi:hypothetical protein
MYKFIKTVKQLVVSLPFISEGLTFMMYPTFANVRMYQASMVIQQLNLEPSEVSMVTQQLNLEPSAVSMVIQQLNLEPLAVSQFSITQSCMYAIKYNEIKYKTIKYKALKYKCNQVFVQVSK